MAGHWRQLSYYRCVFWLLLQKGKFNSLSQGLREEVERLSREGHKWESYNVDQLVSLRDRQTVTTWIIIALLVIIIISIFYRNMYKCPHWTIKWLEPLNNGNHLLISWRTLSRNKYGYHHTMSAHNYSRTSSKGPSKKGTTSEQRTLLISAKLYMQYISTSEKRTASLQGTKWLIPKCPLLRGSTVCTILLL